MKKHPFHSPRPKPLSLLGAAVLLACCAVSFADQKKNASAGVFSEDKGKLTIKLDGQTVGREEFEITPAGGGWLAKGNSDIKASQNASSKIYGNLTLQPNGAPISYEWTAQTEKKNGAHVVFANGIANV